MENSPKSSEAKKPEPKKKAIKRDPQPDSEADSSQQTQAQIVQIPSNGPIQLQQVQAGCLALSSLIWLRKVAVL